MSKSIDVLMTLRRARRPVAWARFEVRPSRARIRLTAEVARPAFRFALAVRRRFQHLLMSACNSWACCSPSTSMPTAKPGARSSASSLSVLLSIHVKASGQVKCAVKGTDSTATPTPWQNATGAAVDHSHTTVVLKHEHGYGHMYMRSSYHAYESFPMQRIICLCIRCGIWMI